MNKSLLIFCLLWICNLSVFAQKEKVENINTWFYYLGNHKFHEKWGLHSDFQYRRKDFLAEKSQFLGRIGVEYCLGQGIQVTVGYAFSRLFLRENQSDFASDENRFWEQLSINQSVNRTKIQHRFRLEQRFMEKWNTAENSNVYLAETVLNHRIRYRLMLLIPINKNEMQDQTLFANLFNEVMLGLGKKDQPLSFDQNRLYAGLGWRFNDRFNVQIGYQFQYVEKTNGVPDDQLHILQTGITYNFNLLKTK